VEIKAAICFFFQKKKKEGKKMCYVGGW
jgi:hypothetical protein